MSNSTSASRTLIVTEIAFAAALALVLNLIPHTLLSWIVVELGVIPVLLLSLRRGVLAGLTAGLVWGILTLTLGQGYVLTLTQGFLEYIIAPIATGLAGLFVQRDRISYPRLLTGIILAVGIKYFVHFIAGIIFWSKYAWKGWGAVTYSLVVNGISGILTAIAAIIVIVLIAAKLPKLFTR